MPGLTPRGAGPGFAASRPAPCPARTAYPAPWPSWSWASKR